MKMSPELLASLVAAVGAILAFFASALGVWMTYRLKNVERRDSFADRVGRATSRVELLDGMVQRLQTLMLPRGRQRTDFGDELFFEAQRTSAKSHELRTALTDPKGDFQSGLRKRTSPHPVDLMRLSTIEETIDSLVQWCRDTETLVVEERKSVFSNPDVPTP